MKKEFVLPPVSQIGIVVKDLDKTAEYYSLKFGIGPFRILTADMPPGATINGKPYSGKMKIALAQWGPIQLELMQPIEGAEYHANFLREKGKGIHHLGIRIADLATYDEILNELAKQGIKPVLNLRGERLCFAYLDTQAIGGVIFELIHTPEG